MIIDPASGTADEGGAGWREPGSDFLTYYDDPKLHNIDIIDGDGLSGPRGSGLPGLGGAIRLGEIDSGINHALSVSLCSIRYSADVHYIWPASTCDSYADNPIYGYLGPNPYYTMGTLLAVPADIDLNSLAWVTSQGFNVAEAAQLYGMYIADSVYGVPFSDFGESEGSVFILAVEREAAYVDLGLTITRDDDMEVDPDKIDIEGFTADIIQILHLVKAVPQTSFDK